MLYVYHINSWHLVIYGCIDGYSRRIMYLHRADNNRASTVFELFHKIVQQHGLSSRVHADRGGENLPGLFHASTPSPCSVKGKFHCRQKCSQPTHRETMCRCFFWVHCIVLPVILPPQDNRASQHWWCYSLILSPLCGFATNQSFIECIQGCLELPPSLNRKKLVATAAVDVWSCRATGSLARWGEHNYAITGDKHYTGGLFL